MGQSVELSRSTIEGYVRDHKHRPVPGIVVIAVSNHFHGDARGLRYIRGPTRIRHLFTRRSSRFRQAFGTR